MKDFDLSSIEDLRKQMKCREGLLIDYDYANDLADLEGASKEETVVEGEYEDQGKDAQSEKSNLDPEQKPSGGRTVSLFFDSLYLLAKTFGRVLCLSLQWSYSSTASLIVWRMTLNHSSTCSFSSVPTSRVPTMP